MNQRKYDYGRNDDIIVMTKFDVVEERLISRCFD